MIYVALTGAALALPGLAWVAWLFRRRRNRRGHRLGRWLGVSPTLRRCA